MPEGRKVVKSERSGLFIELKESVQVARAQGREAARSVET
jgi:hypothetical protein